MCGKRARERHVKGFHFPRKTVILSLMKISFDYNRVVFVIAYTRFFSNMLPLSRRPFSNGADLTNAMVHRWNSVVAPEDIVLHLGYFADKCRADEMQQLAHRLNGEKILLKSDYDPFSIKTYKQAFRDVFTGPLITSDGRYVFSFESIPDALLPLVDTINIYGLSEELADPITFSRERHICVAADYQQLFPIPLHQLLLR